MSDIPGVWDYIYKNPHDYGANFAAGMNAGANAKKVKNDKESDAARLAQQKVRDAADADFNKGRLEMDRGKLEADKRQMEIERQRREQERSDKLIERFGPSVVRTPDGQIDVQGSEEAHQRRMELDRKAELLGRQEIITRKKAGPEFDDLKQLPGYLRGQTEEASRVFSSQEATRRAEDANKARIEAAKIRADKGGKSGARDEIETIGGAHFIRGADGSLKPLSKDAERAYRAGAPKTNAVPEIIISRGKDGKLQIQR